VQKLVHCCNWLLTETQCKIISVQQNFSDVHECFDAVGCAGRASGL